MPDDSKDQGRSGHSASEILQGLASVDPGPAWVEFLDRYSQLIMSAANQFEYRQDRIDDCFVYVCEQLSDNHFRRLLKFNVQGKARFRSWLGAVVFNLCVDWHRREFGRVTLTPAIAALPAFDQSVYRLVVEEGATKETAYQTLRADFPDLSRNMVADAVGRLISLLTPRQRWRIGLRGRGRRAGAYPKASDTIEHLPDPGPGPDSVAQAKEELDELRLAVSRLPPEQRILLHLRFQEGLSLKKIAELQNLGDSNRAWRHIRAALQAVSGQIKKNAVEKRKI
jgi:RNA polymerase sigma factor (sigma-70 family)